MLASAQFKSTKLAEYKANPEYDGVSQHEKVRLAGDEWLVRILSLLLSLQCRLTRDLNAQESPLNPSARRLKRVLSKTSKAKYDDTQRKLKKAKTAAQSKEHADEDDVDAF